MKFTAIKIIIWIYLAIFSFTWVFATLEDNSIQEELNKENTQELDVDFVLQSFASCKNMEDVMWEYVQDYWEANWKDRPQYSNYYYKEGGVSIDVLNSVSFDSSNSVEESVSVQKNSSVSAVSDDFSTTNTQVDWVDESDIVKTDGKYVYYYNSKDTYIYIVDATEKENLSIVKKIKVPDNFYNPVLYIDDNRLTIVANGYSQTNYKQNYWYNRNQKTYTIVFDTTDITKPELIKLYATEGYLTKSRKIWDYLYVLSNNSFSIPYYSFKNKSDIAFSAEDMIPKAIELTKTSHTDKQNLTIKDTDYPYEFSAGNTVDCDEISYALPWKDTLEKFDFSPSYNIISVINMNDVEEKVWTYVVAWNNAEIYMSQDNLYMTSYIYQNNDFSCPRNMFCIMPYYSRWENTLIHKINIDNKTLSYQDSTIVPGNPLTQYSMDEHEGNFRIITQKNYPERETGVYILDKDLELLWSLDGLGKTENFKSSRFMGDKLFLVTFEQIDPFYVVDLADDANPKVIWELKIPGYSTYLHPYDENHIIGLGYNTSSNQWGWTVNDGLKIDLYEIDYDRAPAEKIEEDAEGNFQENLWDIYVAQKFTKTIGWYGSYSEALNNPRMFMWNAVKNTLLLPAQIYSSDSEDIYTKTDFEQALFAFEIDKDTGISAKYTTTHIDYSDIENMRIEACSKYTQEASEPVCRNLIDGTQVCTDSKKTYNYIPEYCYADSDIWVYKVNQAYQFRNDYVKRALWIWNTAISISDNKIMTTDLESGEKFDRINME